MHSRPHTQLHISWTHTEPPSHIHKQLCSQTHTQRWSHTCRETPTVTYRNTASWGLEHARHTEEHTALHRDMSPTHKLHTQTQVNSIMISAIPTPSPYIHLFMHAYMQQIFIEPPICAKLYSRLWASSSEQSRDPCSRGVNTPVGLPGSKQIHIYVQWCYEKNEAVRKTKRGVL